MPNGGKELAKVILAYGLLSSAREVFGREGQYP
jgi:hypothetical protein